MLFRSKDVTYTNRKDIKEKGSKQLQTGQTTPVLKVPMSVMYFSLVLTFALILVIQAVVLVEKVMDLKNKEVEA